MAFVSQKRVFFSLFLFFLFLQKCTKEEMGIGNNGGRSASVQFKRSVIHTNDSDLCVCVCEMEEDYRICCNRLLLVGDGASQHLILFFFFSLQHIGEQGNNNLI